MFCNNCGIQYDVTPVEEGKSKFCRNCGCTLYKNIHGQIVFNFGESEKGTPHADPDAEKKLIEAKLEADRLKKELEQLEKERLVREVQEREKKEQELKALQKQLENERQERERLEQEKRQLEKQEQERLDKVRLEAEAAEQERLKQLRIEQEAAEKIRLEKEEKERELQEQVRQALEKIKLEEAEKLSQSETPEENRTSITGKIPKVLLTLIVLTGMTAAVTYFYRPELITGIFNTRLETGTVTTDIDIPEKNADSLLLEQIRSGISDRSILSWGTIRKEDINQLEINSKSESGDTTRYEVKVHLSNPAQVQAMTELTLTYNKVILSEVTLRSITYKNTAPTNAWYTFQPIPDCYILVNTNGQPIQVKSCNNCSVISINSTAENPTRLTSSANIFITSGNSSDVTVDFKYIPNSVQL